MGEYFLLSTLSLIESGGKERNKRVYSLEFVWVDELLELAPVNSGPCTSASQIALVP